MKPKTVNEYKVGHVAIIGRPNVGKSTLLNAMVQQKVAIISSKPQTTRSEIMAYLEDQRGQIFFIDTPGFYAPKGGGGQLNTIIKKNIYDADMVLYVIDHTRDWGEEDERVWLMLQDINKPVILVINKIDVAHPSYKQAYLDLLADEVSEVIEVSAFQEKHVQAIVSRIFDLLPPGVRNATVDQFPSHLLSQTSRQYLAEIVREKVYWFTGQEVPYLTSVRITDIDEDEAGNKLKIKGEIVVPETRYKPILIGKAGRKIKEITDAAKKELLVATNKQVDMRLMVVVEK